MPRMDTDRHRSSSLRCPSSNDKFPFLLQKNLCTRKFLSWDDCFFDLVLPQWHDSFATDMLRTFFKPFFKESDVKALVQRQMTQKRRNASVLASLVAKLNASFGFNHRSAPSCAATVGNPCSHMHHIIRGHGPQAKGAGG